jgi:hypothetical protein
MGNSGVEIVNPGNLVVPADNEEYMFEDPQRMDHEVDHVSFFWYHPTVGVVVESKKESWVRKRWYPIKVLVDGQVGWTYSDYVEVIG